MLCCNVNLTIFKHTLLFDINKFDLSAREGIQMISLVIRGVVEVGRGLGMKGDIRTEHFL